LFCIFASPRHQVWLDCAGENPADNEAIGDIKYFPSTSGFSSQYFPFVNQVTCEEIEESNVLELSTGFPSRICFKDAPDYFGKFFLVNSVAPAAL
jgi:hypothetical protein